MNTKSFLKVGHWPTLLSAFLYFDVSFMVWVMLGPLGPYLAESLKLNATDKGFLVAIPLLAGSVFRPLLGALADSIGGRKTGMLGLCLTLIPLFIAWQFANSLQSFYVVGVLLGIAGASFAVALPLASRWYPPEYQGIAMGIAGAGNSGTVLATLFAPRLAATYGWHMVFGVAMIAVSLVLCAFFVLAKDSPAPRKPFSFAAYGELLREPDAAWFSFFYSITFGGFVGLASFLTIFAYDQYHLTKVQAGDFATVAVIFGSMLRPLGGWLADKFGGYRILLGVLSGATVCMFFLSTLPVVTLGLMGVATVMAMFGIGNGAVFQIIPQRFGPQVGLITGLVGAAGGIGGFCLPTLLGYFKSQTGSFSTGLALVATIIAIGFSALLLLGPAWLRSWPTDVARRTGVFSLARSRQTTNA